MQSQNLQKESGTNSKNPKHKQLWTIDGLHNIVVTPFDNSTLRFSEMLANCAWHIQVYHSLHWLKHSILDVKGLINVTWFYSRLQQHTNKKTRKKLPLITSCIDKHIKSCTKKNWQWYNCHEIAIQNNSPHKDDFICCNMNSTNH